MKRFSYLFALIVMCTVMIHITAQSNQLAATLEVLESRVEMRRVNTEDWIEIGVESIVGVGDSVRTGETGMARITFFADGTEMDILPNTEMVIEEFAGDEERFTINASILIGQAEQRLNRLLDANSSYEIQTPAMVLGARGTVFAIRVDEGGERVGMLVREGEVAAESTTDGEVASVPIGYGIRANEGSELSDVVLASSFDELDSALDGCTTSIVLPDDVSLNVRSRPDVSGELIGWMHPDNVNLLMGRTETTSWYRVSFRGGFGWILSTTASVPDCSGLRVFPDDTGDEDASLYTTSGEEGLIPLPEATDEADMD